MNTEPFDIDKSFDRVFPCLKKEELEEVLRLSFTGLPVHEPTGITIYMGTEAYQKLQDFKLEMIKKYD